MRKTKWYLGLLDFLGIANFVGPDELQKQLGDSKFEQSITDYNNTPEAQQYVQEDFGSEAEAQNFLNRQSGSSQAAPTQPATQPASQPSAKPTLDPLSWLIQTSLSPR
jgi:hypothetical protein